MARQKKDPDLIIVDDEEITIRPAKDPLAREKQLTNLAYNLAEQKLRDGTAADSTINYFLKLGSEREATERLKLRKETLLLEAKVESLEASRANENAAQEAMEAMQDYGIH